MIREDFNKIIKLLEQAYDNILTEEKKDIWFTLFEKVDADSFRKAIYECIKRYHEFPKPHDIYKILDEMKAIPHRGEWRPVKPYVFYYDELGRTYQLCSKDGQYKNPPDRLVQDDGTVLYRWRSPIDTLQIRAKDEANVRKEQKERV